MKNKGVKWLVGLRLVAVRIQQSAFLHGSGQVIATSEAEKQIPPVGRNDKALEDD
jgi:hypothetical protein